MRRVSRYHVFLSFRGPEVRRGFVDGHEVHKGKDIDATIKHAIECSRIRIPIFSSDYATSLSCLKEISLIAQQGRRQGRTIPLFYKIDPSHVRHPDLSDSPFAGAFQNHQSSGRLNDQEIRESKAALFTVSNLSGWSLDDTNGYEAALVKRVVRYVSQHLKQILLVHSFLQNLRFFSMCNWSRSGMRRVSRYDVFLSFRGPDVRRGFVDHLFNAFTKEGIHAFMDGHELHKGKDINATIKDAIECSRIRIPIFSPDYATSSWCLKEISLIAQQGQRQGRTIPLFYKIDPSHVRHPDRSDSPFAQAFEHHQSSGKLTEQEIRESKAALITVSTLSGWSLDDTNGCEAELVQRVVRYVSQHIKES